MKTLAITLSGIVGGTAIIDESDYEKVKNYCWSCSAGYARAKFQAR